MTVLVAIAHSLEMAGLMLWETVWALILGFALSGIVQAFISRREMEKALGRRGFKEIVRASVFGACSSSCSYAASAMAKTLFARGADFVSSLVFMFASTNLVIELGIVLWVLVGWQFALAELVGGVIMIGLLALTGRLISGGSDLEALRGKLDAGGHGHAAAEQQPLRVRLRSLAGWSDAGTYALADLKMLRKEMLIGYGIAGVLAALVPASAWHALFISGHGTLTTLENAFIGPLIANVSFVCSVGNVPLAAALWQGGINFGGVVAFVFADLVALPLLLVYRRYYGGRLALRMFVFFWLLMSVSGLAVEEMFGAAGIIPAGQRKPVFESGFHWGITGWLNGAFLLVLAVLYWLARNRQRLGGGAGQAFDPVCQMNVEIASAPAQTVYRGTTYYFCADHCRVRFEREPERYLGGAAGTPSAVGAAGGRGCGCGHVEAKAESCSCHGGCDCESGSDGPLTSKSGAGTGGCSAAAFARGPGCFR